MEPLVIRVLFIKEFDGKEYGWAAIGLEKLILGQGRTIPEAKQSFERTLRSQLYLDAKAGLNPLEHIPQAPREDWDLWNKASKLDQPQQGFPLPVDVPPAWQLGGVIPEFRVA